MLSSHPRSLFIQAPCLLLLLAFSFSSIDAAHVLRRWESTGIVNGTAENEFTCKCDSRVTIHISRRCDGKVDCKDRSDEQGCTECRTPFFLKGTDGLLECFTAEQVKEDKREKEERQWEYRRVYRSSDTNCSESKLEKIWKRWDSDCTEDEITCSTDSLCLPKTSICDGVNDCPHYKYDNYRSYWEGRWESEEGSCCKECKKGAKKCAPSNKCIASTSICDGKEDCSDGSDEKDCTVATCKGALCSNGRCIKAEKVCDGVIDCEDASDEQDCTTSCGAAVTNTTVMPAIEICDSKKYLKTEVCAGLAPSYCSLWAGCGSCECDSNVSFKCRDGKCISKSKVCDGKRDCDWGDDEQACLAACTKSPFFSCVNNGKVKCMAMSAKCDGVRDCSDGKDEKNCAKCPANAFKCDGECKLVSTRCNGVKDCKDGSDEKNCSCEECNKGRLDMYSCEKSGVCMKRTDACYRGKSTCWNATARDELFCRVQSQKKNFREGGDNSRL